MPKKCILILLDGLGDRSYEELGNQTPLQAARTPVLDKLAEMGANGLYHASFAGQALPSENAHFMMFGYDMADFPGRGVLEALGAGTELTPGDVAILTHFVSLSERDGYLVLEKRKPEMSENEISDLTHVVRDYENQDVSIDFTYTGGIRGILTLHGEVSRFITDTDPVQKGLPLAALKPWADHAHNPAAIRTADVLKEYLLQVYQRLKAHPVNLSKLRQGLMPVNGLVTQRAGQLGTPPRFSEKYGLRGLSISSGIVYWGLCAYIGMDYRRVTDTGHPGDDIAERLLMARKSLDDYDMIHIHTKTPDEAAHEKDPALKKSVIESLDRGIGQAIRVFTDDPQVFVIIASDHSTPSSGPLVHSGETVPLLFHGKGVRRDHVRRFDEISAGGGALGCVRGRELMYLMLNHLDRCKLHGLMDMPVDQPFWPGNYEPFRIRQIP
ncbi:alkaline phosphatase family protein [Desulfobacterales bacterium HSG2]|nr:alkaline phosphatase family protein [Desulfobacterales bacterium HSG2]